MPEAMPKREEVRERTVARTWVGGDVSAIKEREERRGEERGAMEIIGGEGATYSCVVHHALLYYRLDLELALLFSRHVLGH